MQALMYAIYKVVLASRWEGNGNPALIQRLVYDYQDYLGRMSEQQLEGIEYPKVEVM